MQQDLINTVNDFGKNAFEAAKALGEINGKLVERAMEKQLNVANLCVEGSMKQVKLAQDTKDPKEFWNKQQQLVEEYADKFMDLAKQQVELVQKANADYQAWFEKGLQQANGSAKAAAKKAA